MKGFKRPRWTIGPLAIAFILCCSTLRETGAAGRGGQQLSQKEVNPHLDCPDASLQSFNTINFTKIRALQNDGIAGLPCDAVAENGKSDTRSFQHGFDYYSWLTFLALNSPASGAAIGRDAPAVWETYKQLPDVMLPKGKAPDDWVETERSPLVGANEQVPLNGCPAAKGKMIIHMDMEETYNEPFKSGPLFDQNGNYALFVIFMNQPMFQYINQNALYSLEGQEAFSNDVDFPNGSDGKAKGHPETAVGAIMIKASWRLMGASDVAKPKYHMTDGLLYRGPNSCIPVKLGLIGFHVGHKTVTRQQWIWTTFEHRLNVPSQQDVDNKNFARAPYNFYNPGCNESDCPANETPTGPWDPDALGWSPFPKDPKFKSQIVRTGINTDFNDGGLTKLEDDVKSLNDLFHNSPQIAGTVWENYDLITTQWPSGFPCAGKKSPGALPDPTCTPFPTFLANSTLETFSQQQRDGGVPLATSSCISCHNNATTKPTHNSPTTKATRSDFTYILEKAHSTQENNKHD